MTHSRNGFRELGHELRQWPAHLLLELKVRLPHAFRDPIVIQVVLGVAAGFLGGMLGSAIVTWLS